MDDPKRELLRHAVATLAYRGWKTLRDASDDFTEYRISETSRTPGQILAHIGDLLDWALAMAKGKPTWHDSAPQRWDQDTQRFFDALAAFDTYLVAGLPLETSAEKLLQGPIADALTHVGQIAMLRRVSGSPVRGENYLVADIQAGRIGRDQAAPKKEF